MNSSQRFRGCLLGLAAGDAVGTTVEFQPRGSFAPVTDMVGGGPFDLQPGQWTDDTSMALCLATSLVEVGAFDAVDQMNRYCDWRDDGYLSSTGDCFDIGNTVSQALSQYKTSGNPFSGSTHPRSAGNGCLMRLAPIPMFYFPDRDRAIQFSGESSRTTHGAPECIDATRLFGNMLFRALSGASKTEILFEHNLETIASPAIQAIADGEYQSKRVGDIRGTGYVVDSLEAALWCFWTTESYEQAILAAANLGDDADTTAAICGQVAGAYYGESGIPTSWLKRLAMGEQIAELADRLHTATP
ncbi:ADP-ribosylglycohydrolase family protein [Nodosilinea sp. FACHB-131]|uniref:ADP-ribosylglycohydrolase family protein n=1 Tax=Cyanophyceae TaxID=3028117 RepID=UPI001681D2D6|nr:ADP-ribosylglycohydrolase family protein [Nodosilinea sp. FACHB-131]MBD1874693.1 ADP-ribosylglycohydrolase family protein [Nodosilinea sp. FACHB-131]